jgi:hypothetical protein
MRLSKSFQHLRITPSEPSSAANSGSLRAWALICFVSAIGVVALAVGGNPGVELLPFMVFGLTVVGAEHRDRLFGDETSVSGTIVVAMAAVVGFSRGAWLLGPTTCCALAGVYWPHLRRCAWSRVAVNTASMALAAAAAAAVFHETGGAATRLGLIWLSLGVAALCAFWIVNSMILGAAVAIIQRRSLRVVCFELVRSDTGLLPFAVLGLFSGYVVLQVGIFAGWLLLLAVLLGLDVLVIRKSGRGVVQRFALRVGRVLGARGSIARRHARPPIVEVELSDDDVLDVVRGAILDLPASRVPES